MSYKELVRSISDDPSSIKDLSPNMLSLHLAMTAFETDIHSLRFIPEDIQKHMKPYILIALKEHPEISRYVIPEILDDYNHLFV